MSVRTKIVVPVLLVLVAAGAWWILRNGGDGASALEASGTVEATETDLGFQMAGRVARIHPLEGDEVREGELLAELDTATLAAARAVAAAQLAAAEARLRELRSGSRPAEVRSAEAALDAAREREEEALRDAERSRRLHDGGAISRQALDQAETRLRVAISERIRAEQGLELVREGPRRELIDAQEAGVEQARAGLRRAEAALDDARIRAPFPGVVTLRHREPGETVAPGAPVLTLLDRNDRWVRIYVSGDRLGAVSVGQSASIRSDTWPDRRYEGRVVFVGNEAEFTPRNVQTPEERTRLVYPVKVRITGDPDFELKPGLPADVSLDTGGAV